MAGDEQTTAKAMRAPDPEEWLSELRQDLIAQAERLSREADAAEETMLAARARASCLRGAANGVGEALEGYAAHVAMHAKERASREADAAVPSKSGYAVHIPPEYR